ncbi:MAG: c-type cytochrome [Geminicoccaceae bacterium]
MGRVGWLPLIGLLMLATTHQVEAAGDPEAGKRVFRVCAACHTLAPGEHRTGPSLAGVFGRKAGAAAGFHRYSQALRSADLVWGKDTLDAFLVDPQGFVPGNRMTFAGIEEPQARADLIAYLQTATAEGAPAEAAEQGGMMAAPQLTDLRRDVGPNNRITSIRYCGDTYTVALEAGEAHQFWEFNLRFKTDSSDKGPPPGQPVLLPASMMGDRAFVIFAAPAEISASIEAKC